MRSEDLVFNDAGREYIENTSALGACIVASVDEMHYRCAIHPDIHTDPEVRRLGLVGTDGDHVEDRGFERAMELDALTASDRGSVPASGQGGPVCRLWIETLRQAVALLRTGSSRCASIQSAASSNWRATSRACPGVSSGSRSESIAA
jgi:hypothetical protein